MPASEKDKQMGITVEVEQADPDQEDQVPASCPPPRAHDLVGTVPDADGSPTLIETIGYLLSIQDGYGPSDSTWDMEDFD
ncbi:hypothetical protein BO71DRAFT_38555 [Aspergillus ellipticus CBS 707.79]|uniref:Uncharacterized protein n=1 Tax=Aspergillus ellipticus CBS 707.79 TaxID=1448320 RepID=A0A319ELI7_9EURO|nr:hypothetical protein BO71DRAFT_38555 [Aspergillus ellipticus CBS 707.79]